MTRRREFRGVSEGCLPNGKAYGYQEHGDSVNAIPL